MNKSGNPRTNNRLYQNYKVQYYLRPEGRRNNEFYEVNSK
jgi:hypothetical protein